MNRHWHNEMSRKELLNLTINHVSACLGLIERNTNASSTNGDIYKQFVGLLDQLEAELESLTFEPEFS